MKYIPLVQVCDFQGGSQPPKDQWIDHEKDGYIRMLQIRDFTQPDKDYAEYVRVSKTIKTCNEDDILIGRYGASVGKILTGLAGAYNVAIIKTIPDTSKLSKRFLYHYLNSPYFQNFILSVGSRAAQAGFNKDDLSDAQIPDLSLEGQSNVVSQLDKVSELITLRKEQLAKLDQLVKSRFVELFGSIKNNHQRYPVVKIGSCAKLQGGFAFKSSDYLNDGIRLVQISNVNKDTLDWDSINCVPQAFLQKYKDFELHVGDLVLAMTRPVIKSLDAVKIATVSENDVPSLLNQRVGRFVVDRKKLHSVYLMVLCQMPEFREYVEAMSGNSLQPNISSKQVEDYSIVLPPLALQEQFAAFVQQTDKSKMAIQQSLDKLDFLKKSLMQEYFG